MGLGRSENAWTDAGLSAAGASRARSRGALAWRHRGPFAIGRGTAAPHHLQGGQPAGPRPCQRSADAARRGTRHGDRHHGLEHLAAPGNLVRHHGRAGHRPHAEPAIVQRAAHLHHQPCRRSVDLHRPDLRSALREAAARPAASEGLRHHDRRRAHAGDHAAQYDLLRRPHRGGRSGICLAGLRREHRLRHVLYVGDDGASKGRALLAPLQCAAWPHVRAGRCHGDFEPRPHHAGGSDVPCQCLVDRLLGGHCPVPPWSCLVRSSTAPRSTKC